MENKEVFDFVEELFRGYKGEIERTDEYVSITALNKLDESHIVKCECSVKLMKSPKYPYSVDVYETTYCIKGGRGCPCENIAEVEKEAIRCLQDFGFKKRKYEQLRFM